RGPVENQIDLSDREHIRVHLDGSQTGLFISKPVRGRHSGKVSIQLTRAIRDGNGALRGVVVASMDPRYFERFWTTLRRTGPFMVDLAGSDGYIRATSGRVDAIVDSGPVYRDLIGRLSDRKTGRIVEPGQHGSAM